VTDESNHIDAGQITKTIAIGQALPVSFTNFDVNLDANKNAVLSWTTESEQGSVRFDVLRSNDGNNFTTIGSVGAAGVSTHAINYSFTDVNPGAKSYYKVSIVKADGVETSKTVSIAGGRIAGFSINPNPASNNITITGISNIKTVSIYDASGRLVQTATNSYISVRNLSAGIYFVTVVTTDGNKTNGKFIKK
jgi:fibronectin type 3 domain-containing protein